MNRKYFDRDISKLTSSPFGIFVDQAGYTPDSIKTAVMPFECSEFTVIDEDEKTVFSGKTKLFGYDESSGDTVYSADLSQLTAKGTYRVCADGRTSARFTISDDVYNKVLHDTSKAFYFLRCGCGLDEKYAGAYHHLPCHCDPAVLWEDKSTFIDVKGGWHDAGDYGRYVTAGACACAHLLYAYKLFPKVFDRLKLNIPEKGMPDILSEIKYELEWLIKMQRSDGGVYHKVTTMLHAPFVMPEDDKEQLIIFPVSSMATADFAAAAALAGSIYKNFDTDFADRLINAAEKSVTWLDSNPDFIGFENPEGCNTGGYYEKDDYSNRYWAYAEMYSLTGERKYHDKMKALMSKGFPLTELGYWEIGGLGSLAYILTDRPKDEQLYKQITDAFSGHGEHLKGLSDRCGYGTAMSKEYYGWGSNMLVMKNAMIFAINDLICGDKESKKYARRQLDYLLGTNALGISYVTGTGEYRTNNPHLRPAFADGIDECIPGMVAGGPNGRPADPYAEEVIPKDTPPMKCYADDAASYSLNEITIYWNSPAVFVIAYLSDK